VQKKKASLYEGMNYLSKDEFYHWSTSSQNFHDIFTNWEKSNYDRKLSPSVDRIWPMFGYVKGNIRWITHSENSSRSNTGFLTKNENIFWTSDLHLLHKNILKYGRDEFKDVDEMHQCLISNWNKVVGESDLVFNLGDVCLGNLEDAADILSELNGFIYTISANHDSEKSFDIFNTISDKQIYTDEYIKEVRIDHSPIIMCHFPMYSWNKSDYGSYHVFGHCHASVEGVGKSMDVGIDNAKKLLGEYRPFSHNEVISFLDRKEVFNIRYGE
jgi:calcineurin-like phosphoesterase family protein